MPVDTRNPVRSTAGSASTATGAEARSWLGWVVFASGSLVGLGDVVGWMAHHG